MAHVLLLDFGLGRTTVLSNYQCRAPPDSRTAVRIPSSKFVPIAVHVLSIDANAHVPSVALPSCYLCRLSHSFLLCFCGDAFPRDCNYAVVLLTVRIGITFSASNEHEIHHEIYVSAANHKMGFVESEQAI